MIVNPVEPVLQSYQIPLSVLEGDLQQISFQFSHTQEGFVALDDIGLSNTPTN